MNHTWVRIRLHSPWKRKRKRIGKILPLAYAMHGFSSVTNNSIDGYEPLDPPDFFEDDWYPKKGLRRVITQGFVFEQFHINRPRSSFRCGTCHVDKKDNVCIIVRDSRGTLWATCLKCAYHHHLRQEE